MKPIVFPNGGMISDPVTLQMANILEGIPQRPPIVALTATATVPVADRYQKTFKNP